MALGPLYYIESPPDPIPNYDGYYIQNVIEHAASKCVPPTFENGKWVLRGLSADLFFHQITCFGGVKYWPPGTAEAAQNAFRVVMTDLNKPSLSWTDEGLIVYTPVVSLASVQDPVFNQYSIPEVAHNSNMEEIVRLDNARFDWDLEGVKPFHDCIVNILQPRKQLRIDFMILQVVKKTFFPKLGPGMRTLHLQWESDELSPI